MVTLAPYSVTWPALFSKEKALLERAFHPLPLHFYHIGSTAIEDCTAKPIIDILGVVSDITLLDTHKYIPEGYQALGEYGMKQRRYFRKEGIHLHIFEDSDPEVSRHLRFVAYMKKHPEVVNAYSNLKSQLAKKFPDDIQNYTQSKSAFIKKIDYLAAQERTPPLFYPSIGPRKQIWSEAEIIRALHVNMHLQMIYFAKFLPGMELISQPDATLVQTESMDDSFNYVLGAHFEPSTVHTRIESILDLYRRRNLPFSWWVSDIEDTPQLPSLLKEHGLSLKETNVGMYLQLDREKEFISPQIKRVAGLRELQEFSRIITEIGGPKDCYEKIYQPLPALLYQEGAPLEMYLLYDAEGKVITTGLLLFHANVAGIYYIATTPQHRKRGYASLMMKFLINRAKDKGYTIAILAASEQGKPVYQKLGFRECCQFSEWI